MAVDNCFRFGLDENKALEMSMDFEYKIESEEADVASTPTTKDRIIILPKKNYLIESSIPMIITSLFLSLV